MKRLVAGIWLLLTCVCGCLAQKLEQGVSSDYSNGAFHTTAVYKVDVTVERLDSLFDEIYTGIQNKPTKNLRWLWKNLGHHDNVENDITLSEHGFFFNPETSDYLLRLGLAMKKGDKPMMFDVQGQMTKSRSGKKKRLMLSITKRLKIVDGACFCLYSIPQPDGKACVMLQSELDFGWFFTLFFTENRYRSLMEWRLQGVALNIKKRAEGDDSPNY